MQSVAKEGARGEVEERWSMHKKRFSIDDETDALTASPSTLTRQDCGSKEVRVGSPIVQRVHRVDSTRVDRRVICMIGKAMCWNVQGAQGAQTTFAKGDAGELREIEALSLPCTAKLLYPLEWQ